MKSVSGFLANMEAGYSPAIPSCSSKKGYMAVRWVTTPGCNNTEQDASREWGSASTIKRKLITVTADGPTLLHFLCALDYKNSTDPTAGGPNY